MLRSRWLEVSLALLMTVAGPSFTGAQQGSRDLYKNAMRAVEGQDWETAIQLLRQAIEDDPNEKAGTFKKYLPHYYLGLSLYELGNCKSALTVWAKSHQQGVVTRLKEVGTMQQGVAVCRKKILRQETSNDLAVVRGFAAALGDLRDQPELAASWASGSPSWEERFVAAEQLMTAAQSILEKSDNQVDLADLERAMEQVVSAAQQLEVIQTEARTKYTEVQAKLDVRSRLIGMLLEDANKVLASTAYLQPYPPRLGQIRGRVQSLVTEAENSGDTVHPDQLDDLRLRLSKELERLKQASTPPPSSLLDAARAFFAADYQQVLELLDGKSFPSGRQSAHAHLFRAASHYSLWIAGDSQDEETREEASRAVRSCREEDIALLPLKQAFSPGFIEFFFIEGQARAPIPLDRE